MAIIGKTAAICGTGAEQQSGTGPFTPTSLTANAVLIGNGTGAIQASGITSTAGGGGLTAPASTDLTLNAGSGSNNNVVLTPVGSGQVRIAGNILLGGLTTNGTGVMQLPTGTTAAGGATFGNVNLFQTASGAIELLGVLGINNNNGHFGESSALTIEGTGKTTPIFININGTSAGQYIGFQNGGGQVGNIGTDGTNFTLGKAAGIALTLDTSQNAQFVGVVTHSSTVATPAGGSTTARILFGTTAGFGIYYGSSAPTVSAAQGSLYLRSDGSSTITRAYINTNGSTTWTPITTVG